MLNEAYWCPCLKSALFRLCWSLYVCLCTLYQTCLSRCAHLCMHMCVCGRCCAPVCFSRIDVPLSADGLMVQITVETMAELRRSLREMKEYTVTCGRLGQSESQELVCVQWVEEKCTVNKGRVCPLKFVWQLPLCSDRTFKCENCFFSPKLSTNTCSPCESIKTAVHLNWSSAQLYFTATNHLK